MNYFLEPQGILEHAESHDDLRAQLAAARNAKELWHKRFCTAVAWIMVLVAIDLSAIAIFFGTRS